MPEPVRCSKGSSKRKVYSSNANVKGKKRSQIADNLTLKHEELKEEWPGYRVGRGREIIKIKAEVSEIEIRETIERISEAGNCCIFKDGHK